MKKHFKLFILLSFICTLAHSQQVYMFTSFREPATDGLHLLYSYDGYKWKDLGRSFLTPAIGASKLMRDPSICQGPDGVYHLVWTTGWKGDNGFGYASSKDLSHWSDQRYLDVMKHEPTTVNVWAPEIFYDDDTKQFIIVWASTIPNRFPRGIEDENNNHRLYYITTKDFKQFSKTALFYDPGFSVIDAVIVKRASKDYVLVLKDNTRPNRNLKVAFSKSAIGPYGTASPAFTGTFIEGPSTIKVGKDWLIYYDVYQQKKYGAMKTPDFQSFTDISNDIEVPEGHKHGTIFMTNKKTVEALLKQ